MRVVLLCTHYHEGGGGAEILTHHIAIGLRERGYEVEIWYLYNKFAREKSPWERIVYEGKPCGPASAFAIAGKFISALIGFRPDAIVAFHPLANILGTVAGVFGFVPARVASQHAQATCYRRWLRWLDRVLGSSFVYTRNIVVARTLARTFDDYPAAYRAKLSVVSNSVPGPTEVLGQREARQRCSLPLEGIVIGTVGRLVSQKNQKFLVELIAALPQVHLAIAGAGELRDELVETARRLKVADRLHLAGPLPWEKIHAFLSSLDLFVFPSRFEGFPIALVEALQAGVPVLANDIPAIREVLMPAPGLTGGVLVPISDRRAWLREIASLTTDQPRRSALIEAGRRVADLYSLQTMIDGYESAIIRSSAGGVAQPEHAAWTLRS